MKASAQSLLLATLIGTIVGGLMFQYELGTHIWPAHPNLCALFVTAFATIISQRVWSPDYFRRRAG